MKVYKVKLPSLALDEYLVEAESDKEAVQLVIEGEGSMVGSIPEVTFLAVDAWGKTEPGGEAENFVYGVEVEEAQS